MAFSSKLIVVLVDGLKESTARKCCGFLMGLVEEKKGTLFSVVSELPSLSRPLYETLFTGRVPVTGGFVTNSSQRKAGAASVFDLVHAAGGVTALAGYGWMCELFAHTPYCAAKHKHLVPGNGSAVDAGWFYTRDDLPDTELFAEGDWLIAHYSPDFCVIHPMGVDEAGHVSEKGGADAAYDRAARNVDWLLAERVPAWLAAGYRVIVTADHGMGDDRSHGGTDDAERRVPCFCFGDGMNGLTVDEEPVKQRYLAAFFARTMGLTPASTMADCADHIKFAAVCG